jgi:LPPG:FO 2-phospho-L-lactate transferase
MSRARRAQTYVALSGGVGGAKLALGLADLLGARLSLVVNTGDDFEHLGLHISPDLDTALYTLAGLVNSATGWGRKDETWTFMQAVEKLGGPVWFRLGDGDLATHVDRTARLKAGETLTGVSLHLARRLGVAPGILPMSDNPVRTMVETDGGTLGFQQYFVREQCRPMVRSIRFAGADAASPTPQVIEALSSPALAGVIVCPSNPWLSVDPILAVPGMRQAIRAAGVPIVAVSPIIAGRAVKGPTAKIMRELGLPTDIGSIARHYAGLIDGLVIDVEDERLASELAVPVHVTNTLMRTHDDKVALARQCLAFCDRLSAGERRRAGAMR